MNIGQRKNKSLNALGNRMVKPNMSIGNRQGPMQLMRATVNAPSLHNGIVNDSNSVEQSRQPIVNAPFSNKKRSSGLEKPYKHNSNNNFS
jgi:hypothetical protein